MTTTLVYDGDCGICQASVGLLARAGSTAVAVPSWAWVRDHPEHEELTRTTVLLVGDDGSVEVEEAAVAGVLRTTRAPLRWLARVVDAPGARVLSRSVYRLVARHRARLSKAIGREACSIDSRPGGAP